jgi:hypothetical protein
MKFIFSIISMIAVFNLGTHAQVICETPHCDTTDTPSCCCDVSSHGAESNCCEQEIKCVTQTIDGAVDIQTRTLEDPSFIVSLVAVPALVVNESHTSIVQISTENIPDLSSFSRNIPLLI